MKKWFIALAIVVFAGVTLIAAGCNDAPKTADSAQRDRQEKLQSDEANQVGMPDIKNFREAKILKDLYEKRDQMDLATYTYVYNEMSGKFVFLGESVGYGIPYSTQFSNPDKVEYHGDQGAGNVVIPQAEPNGLFTPSSTEGTWVMLKDPNGSGVTPVYVEPRVLVSQFKLPDSIVQH